MAGIIIPTTNPFPCAFNPTARIPRLYRRAPPPRVTDDDVSSSDTSADPSISSSSSPNSDFDRRILEISTKYRSGKGKKAELRKAKKSGSLNPQSLKKKSIMLPPVPLLTPTSITGAPVELGFTPYSERLNGALAGLGLAALLLVELGSGKSVLKYHTVPIVFVQLYTAACLGAVFVKYEKERVSVWPKEGTGPSDATVGGEN